MLNRTIAPPVKDAVDFSLNLKPYTLFYLKNGVPVYTIDAGQTDVINVELVFGAGNCFDTKKLVANATCSLLKNGTGSKTAFQINEHFEFYGAQLNTACYNETAVVSVSGLNKFLPQMLPVVNEILTDPVFPEEELGIFKQNSKQRLSVNLKKCDFVAGRLIDAYLYGEQHPYGVYAHAEDYGALNREELVSFYKKYYQQGSCIIFVSGKLPADIEAQLNSNFGSLPFTAWKPGAVTNIAKPAAEKKYRIQNDAAGVQGAIRIATAFPNRLHPDFIKVMVLNNLFGGFFGSRLMSNIREDKGYTYGIYSYIQNHLQQSAWVISTEAGKDVCEATIQEVYNEMKKLREELVDDEELSLVRNYMIGTILGDLDGPFQIMGRWKNIILNGLDAAYFTNTIEIVKTIKAEEVQALANKYLVPENFYELVVI